MDEFQLSPPCYIHNLPWKIRVKSHTAEAQKWLSVYLLCSKETKSASWSCNASVELRLLSNKEGQEPFMRKYKHLFCNKEVDWGYKQFVTWEELRKVENGYVKDGSITLEAHVVADVPQGVS